jgi:hypothetical protein
MDKFSSACRIEILSGVPFFFIALLVGLDLNSLSRPKLCECELVGLVKPSGDSAIRGRVTQSKAKHQFVQRTTHESFGLCGGGTRYMILF